MITARSFDSWAGLISTQTKYFLYVLCYVYPLRKKSLSFTERVTKQDWKRE